MIQAEHFYIAISAALGLVCLVSIFLAGKYIPDKGAKNLLIAALALFAVSAGTLAYCQRILRKSTIAYIADLYKVTEGAFEQVGMFASIAAFADMAEAAAVVLCVLAVKKLISLRTGGQSEGGAE